nr:uncharacterized protein LOC124807122 isoform X2 [Hydra vulgaris]XP_047126611.1 uncharacterized protein LOC124807913 isoform X2 [Hydra vulgaris]
MLEENILTPKCVLCKRVIDNSCKCNLWKNDAYKICKACADSSCCISYPDNVLIVKRAFKKFTAQSIVEISSSSLLVSIFSGQLYSYRHNIYNSGGKAKRNLIDQDLMYLLSEDKSFNSLKTSDYTFKVLLPEAILYLFAKVEGISRIKAEVLLSTYSLQRTTELLNKFSDDDIDFFETSTQFKKGEVIEDGNTKIEGLEKINKQESETLQIEQLLTVKDKRICKNHVPSLVIEDEVPIEVNKSCKKRRKKESRRKVDCPKCGESVAQLKRHLKSRKHNWDNIKASNARLDFGLNLKRKVLSPSKRRSKVQKYHKKTCPISFCLKEVRRLDNHLRQYHKVPTKDVKPLVERATCVYERSTSESESLTESDESLSLEPYFDKEVFQQGANFLDTSTESDEEWLASQYVASRFKNKENLPCHSNDISNSDDSLESADFEDLDDKFYMTSSAEEKFMNEFVDWLISIDGGQKPKRCALKHKSVILGIVRYESEFEINYSNLSCSSFLSLWMEKLNKDNKKPGTIKTYLGSVKHFLDFCIIKERFDIITSEKHSKIKTQISKWEKTLWKSIQEGRYEKDQIDLENFPSAEEIVILDNSDIVLEANKIINTSSTNKLTKTTFCLARDYLLTCITFDNASRPGAVSNMTLNEFKKSIEKKDGFIVSVMKHKTSYKGPAHIVLSHSLYFKVKKYIKFMRNMLDGVSKKDDSYVFLSWSGSPISSSMLSKQFSSFWQKGTGKSCLNPTIVRKYTTTLVHDKYPELKQNTAHLLCHKVTTAEKSYAIAEKRNKVAETSKQIREVQRETYADNQAPSLNLIFESEILRGSITLPEVREKFNQYSLGDISDSKKVKKILDDVRYLIKKNKASDDDSDFNPKNCSDFENDKFTIDNLSYNKHSDIVPSSPTTSLYSKTRNRKEYSQEDLTLVNKHLKQFIDSNTTLLKKEVQQYLESVPECNPLLEKFGLRSLIIKIRTEKGKH